MSFFTTKVLGWVGAILLFTNVISGWTAVHYRNNYNELLIKNETAEAVAKAHKSEVENKNEQVVNQTSAKVAGSISTARKYFNIDRLRPKGPREYLPDAPPGSQGDVIQGEPSIVLPLAQYRQDQLICVTNTILAEAWPVFYEQVRSNFNGTNTSYSPAPRPPRGDLSGSVPRLGGSMDVELGRYERFRTSSPSKISQLASDAGSVLEDSYMVDPGKVSAGDPESILPASYGE